MLKKHILLGDGLLSGGSSVGARAPPTPMNSNGAPTREEEEEERKERRMKKKTAPLLPYPGSAPRSTHSFLLHSEPAWHLIG